jgi:NADH-quinone oxidoreductase subunit A
MGNTESIFSNYIGFGLILVIGIVLGLALPVLGEVMGPLRRNKVKLMPYESGMDPVGGARERFSVKFYLVAMFFIIFDIEIIFMYPWAVQFKTLSQQYGLFPFMEMIVFVVILFVGYIYLYKKGGFEWDK